MEQPIPADDRGSFEALLAAIAARLLGGRLEAFDVGIEDALSRLVEFLDVERSTFGMVDPVDGILRSTHAVARPGGRAFPIGRPIKEMNPWVLEQLAEKRIPVIIS